MLHMVTEVFGQSLAVAGADTQSPYGVAYKKPQFQARWTRNRHYPDAADYLIRNLHYPDAARENNVTGTVVVQFLVSEKGAVSNVKIVRGFYPACDSEALRVVSNMPAWQPATYKRRPVRAVERIPVEFILE